MAHWALDNWWFVITSAMFGAVALWPRFLRDLDRLTF